MMVIEKLTNTRLYNGDCVEVMNDLINQGVKVNLTVTSPPYDNMRSYEGSLVWDFETFKNVAQKIYDITEDGGVCVWVVGDSVKDGSETGTSFRQVLYFMELGFKLHDTMIYEKNSCSFPARRTSKRYTQIFEYMFVLCKGKIRNDISLIADKPNKWAGSTNWGKLTHYSKDGKESKDKK